MLEVELDYLYQQLYHTIGKIFHWSLIDKICWLIDPNVCKCLMITVFKFDCIQKYSNYNLKKKQSLRAQKKVWYCAMPILTVITVPLFDIGIHSLKFILFFHEEDTWITVEWGNNRITIEQGNNQIFNLGFKTTNIQHHPLPSTKMLICTTVTIIVYDDLKA